RRGRARRRPSRAPCPPAAGRAAPARLLASRTHRRRRPARASRARTTCRAVGGRRSGVRSRAPATGLRRRRRRPRGSGSTTRSEEKKRRDDGPDRDRYLQQADARSFHLVLGGGLVLQVTPLGGRFGNGITARCQTLLLRQRVGLLIGRREIAQHRRFILE